MSDRMIPSRPRGALSDRMSEWSSFKGKCLCGKWEIEATVKGVTPQYYCPDCPRPIHAIPYANGWHFTLDGNAFVRGLRSTPATPKKTEPQPPTPPKSYIMLYGSDKKHYPCTECGIGFYAEGAESTLCRNCREPWKPRTPEKAGNE